MKTPSLRKNSEFMKEYLDLEHTEEVPLRGYASKEVHHMLYLNVTNSRIQGNLVFRGSGL